MTNRVGMVGAAVLAILSVAGCGLKEPIPDGMTNGTTTACQSSMAVGTVCSDGTVYAGLSPDGNVPMAASRCDAGLTWDGTVCAGTKFNLAWDNNTTLVSTGATSTIAGNSNTALLAAYPGGSSRFEAAAYCAALQLNGYSDWYLPSKLELQVLYGGRAAIGNFAADNMDYYWSSTEFSDQNSWVIRFSLSNIYDNIKSDGYFVRCVRK